MNPLVTKIVTRLKEPSTYAGIGGLVAIVGISPDTWTAFAAMVASIASFAAAILMPENKA